MSLFHIFFLSPFSLNKKAIATLKIIVTIAFFISVIRRFHCVYFAMERILSARAKPSFLCDAGVKCMPSRPSAAGIKVAASKNSTPVSAATFSYKTASCPYGLSLPVKSSLSPCDAPSFTGAGETSKILGTL